MINRTDLPVHLTAAQTCDYIKAYAAHFDLDRHVQLRTWVKWIKRNAKDTKWQVCTNAAGKDTIRDFDKVVISSGLATKATIPDIEGREKFEGNVLHVQAFKRYVMRSRN